MNAKSSTSQEQQLAIDWIIEKAQKGDIERQKELGNIYLNGSATITQNTKQGLRWLYLVASRGDVKTQIDLASEYIFGHNVKKSFVIGMAFYYLAASGEIVNEHSYNDMWIETATEYISKYKSDYPERNTEFEEAQELAEKLMAKFRSKLKDK